MVDASFMQTLWNMNPISSGCELAEGTSALYTLRMCLMDPEGMNNVHLY